MLVGYLFLAPFGKSQNTVKTGKSRNQSFFNLETQIDPIREPTKLPDAALRALSHDELLNKLVRPCRHLKEGEAASET